MDQGKQPVQSFDVSAIKSATVTVPGAHTAGSVYQTPVKHGLGYFVGVAGFVTTPLDVKPSGLYHMLPYSTLAVVSNQFIDNWHAYIDVDQTNLYFNVAAGSGTGAMSYEGTWTFKYQLLFLTQN